MYIYGKTNVETKGRIILTNFFPPEESPKEITLAIEEGMEMILVEKVDKDSLNLGKIFKLDNKNRVYLPDWLQEELGQNHYSVLFFMYDETTKKRYLSPKTGKLL